MEWWDLHIPILDYGIFLVKTGNIPKSSICELYPGARAAQAILLFSVYSMYYVYTQLFLRSLSRVSQYLGFTLLCIVIQSFKGLLNNVDHEGPVQGDQGFDPHHVII